MIQGLCLFWLFHLPSTFATPHDDPSSSSLSQEIRVSLGKVASRPRQNPLDWLLIRRCRFNGLFGKVPKISLSIPRDSEVVHPRTSRPLSSSFLSTVLNNNFGSRVHLFPPSITFPVADFGFLFFRDSYSLSNVRADFFHQPAAELLFFFGDLGMRSGNHGTRTYPGSPSLLFPMQSFWKFPNLKYVSPRFFFL